MYIFPILSRFKAIFITKCPFSIAFNSTTQGIVARPSGPHSQLCLDLGIEHDEPGNKGVTGSRQLPCSRVLHGLGHAILPSLRAWEL